MKRSLLLVPCVMSIITMMIAGIFFVLDSGQQTNRSMLSVLSFYIIYFLPDLFQDGWVFVIVIMLLLAIDMFGGVAFVETLQSGLIAMTCAARAKEEGFIDKKVERRYRLWSGVPIADLIVAVQMWKRVK